MIFNPLDAVVKAIFLWRDEKKRERWARLIISVSFSGMIAFSFFCGSALVAGKGWAFSIGTGLVSLALSSVGVLLSSPDGRELTLIFKHEIIEAYQKQVDEGQSRTQR